MTKSEVNAFINVEEKKTKKAIDDKYSEMVTTRKYELLEERGFAERARGLQKAINDMHTVVSELENDMHNDSVLSLSRWGMLASKMSNFIGIDKYLSALYYEGDFDKTNVPLIKNEWKATVSETNVSYQNLRNAISKMKADKATEYLEQFGFDVTPLKNNTTDTALISLVDKTKLFYPRKVTPQKED